MDEIASWYVFVKLQTAGVTSKMEVKLQGTYLKGEKEGKWMEYDASGKVIKTTNYVKGQAK